MVLAVGSVTEVTSYGVQNARECGVYYSEKQTIIACLNALLSVYA